MSVDTLCRDNTGQISHNPRKKCLKTQRERIANPSKLTQSHSRAVSSYPHAEKRRMCLQCSARDPLTRDFTNSCPHHILPLLLQ